jgi:hypothetical protein
MSQNTAAGWEQTREAVLRGLNHAMSNRVASLSGLTRILAPGAAEAGPVVAALQAEVERLEQLFNLYALLPAGTSSYVEPLELPRVLSAVAAMHEVRGDLDSPRCTVAADPDTRPIRGHRARVAHACLGVLGLAAHADRDAALEIGCSSSGADSIVRVGTVRVEAAGAEAGEPALAAGAEAEIEAKVEAAGGRLSREPGTATSWEIRFPALGG